MPAAVLIPLLIQYGIPFVEKMIGLWESNGNVSSTDWAILKDLANQGRLSQMTDALIRNGVDPTSDKGKALLALVK